MGEAPRILTVGDIANETGLTRQRIWQLAATERLPASRSNPKGKQHRFYDSKEFKAWRKQQAVRRAAAPAGIRTTRSQRISRKRHERVERLFKILEEKSKVYSFDKKLALNYFYAIARLWWLKRFLPFPEHPLLEGIHALARTIEKIPFNNENLNTFKSFAEEIEKLPTQSVQSRRRSLASAAK